MHPLATPVCKVALFVVSPAIEKSPATTWQVEQVDSEVGMCPVGFACALKKFVPLWQLEQSPVLGWAASATLKVPAAARGRVWKPVYCAPDTSVVGAIG
jgi:hypothetical protein